MYKSVIKFYVSKYHGETNFMKINQYNISFFEQFYIYSFVLINLLFRNIYIYFYTYIFICEYKANKIKVYYYTLLLLVIRLYFRKLLQ